MVRDEREEEQEFLADLHARSGRSLADWMAAITAQGFADKNETIDWLRREGFPFARASWLERIHSNGGRPIYEHAPPRKPEAEPPATPARPARKVEVKVDAQKPLGTDEAALYDKLLAAGKGYRPLYLMLEAEMRKALPNLVILPKTSYLSVGAPKEFAAVTLHATEVRLGLDLGDRPFDPHVHKSKLKGPGPAITHMIILTDARQVDGTLLALLAEANARVIA
ncbi:MAG: DUF5655 domain-containing protein [Hyphomicrobiaceae bacterium]|jgi:hypothetical protein